MNRSLSALVLTFLLLIAACTPGDKQLRLAQLEELERQNVADSLMTNDSLAQSLADFFDRHGTPNERLRAHYILGRTYADLGEAPAALNAYLDAASCADTTAQDCDWAKLSRVHAQSARIFYRLVQPQSLLDELKMAEYAAWRAGDTLVAIESFSQRADAYSLMHHPDSVIFVREKAAQIYEEFGAVRRSAIALSGTLGALLDCGDLEGAKRNMHIYESRSGLFDESGNICRGNEIYYYLKGRYYLVTSRLDSAEAMFRKLAHDGYTLNHQIATAKGLQQLYSLAKNPDSIAKYAELGYVLNDSAYSLSEMENIQRLRLSYNYNRNKLLAEKRAGETRHTRTLLIFIASLAIAAIVSLTLVIIVIKKQQQLQLLQYKHYQEEQEKTQMELLELRASEHASLSALIKRKDEELVVLNQQVAAYQLHHQLQLSSLETRLQDAPVVMRMRQLLLSNPPQQASAQDLKMLRYLINEAIPSFYDELKCLRPAEYDVCLLIRAHFSPSEVCKLTGIKDNYISNLRKRILQKVYGVSGTAKDLDERLLSIH